MKRNPSESGTKNLTDELAELRRLDPSALKQRWRVLYRTEAPAHIGQSLLLQAVAYRLQERVLGGLKSSTRRLLERAAEDSLHRRPPTEAPAARVTYRRQTLRMARSRSPAAFSTAWRRRRNSSDSPSIRPLSPFC
jgi:hypothetical protein